MKLKSWTFGNIIKIFKILRKEYQYKIIREITDEKFSVNQFIKFAI